MGEEEVATKKGRRMAACTGQTIFIIDQYQWPFYRFIRLLALVKNSWYLIREPFSDQIVNIWIEWLLIVYFYLLLSKFCWHLCSVNKCGDIVLLVCFSLKLSGADNIFPCREEIFIIGCGYQQTKKGLVTVAKPNQQLPWSAFLSI